MPWMACRLLKFPSDENIHALYTLYPLIIDRQVPRKRRPLGRGASLATRRRQIATKTKSVTPEDRRSSVDTTLLLVQGRRLFRGCKRGLGKNCS